MKTTYLLNKEQPDGSIHLSVSTFEEWLAVVTGNKSLPVDQQRFFIVDCIADSDDMDRMVIETTAAEYRKWNRERMASARNRGLSKNYQFLSLDAPMHTKETVLNLKDAISSGEQVEEQVCSLILEAQLRETLTAWKAKCQD